VSSFLSIFHYYSELIMHISEEVERRMGKTNFFKNTVKTRLFF
jgi:hypothetical protein